MGAKLSHILVSFPFSSLLSCQHILPPSCIAASLSKVDAHRFERPVGSLHAHPPVCIAASLPKVDGTPRGLVAHPSALLPHRLAAKSRWSVLCTPRGLFSTLIRPHRRRLAPQVEEQPFNVPTALHHRRLGS